METLQFEAIKSSLRQTKDGYSLNLSVHPDDLPEDKYDAYQEVRDLLHELMRDNNVSLDMVS